MNRSFRRVIFVMATLLVLVPGVQAQKKPTAQTYIGFAYPAGGQQGTTFQMRLGGQRLEGTHGAVVSGEGVTAKLIEYRRRLGNQEARVLKEQLKVLKKDKNQTDEIKELSKRITIRTKENVRRPSNAALSTIVLLEITVDPDAVPGERDIRLMTAKGFTNPLPFYIGQNPEVSRKPMITASEQVLGKEHLALRKRPESEAEVTIPVPCTMNGQVASGEVNSYRFKAEAGQKVVISVLARQLVPYIADAVPGWFQPVLALYDAEGREVAFNDDFRFKPDPTILYDVPADGEYVLTIRDSIYRGREDFVYRIVLGETPFITTIFPLGSRMGETPQSEMKGWNLDDAELSLPPGSEPEGIYRVAAVSGEQVSNYVPFSRDDLPECVETDANDTVAHAQSVTLPIIINGRSDRPGDRDIFKVEAAEGDTLVAEVYARRLDSPLDSILTITDAEGRIIALNDDHADPGSGLNTHHADSYLMTKLPVAGTYYVQLADTTRRGGDAYGYRLRISQPRPDFSLRTVPSRINLKGKSGGSVEVYAVRSDGYEGPIQLRLSGAPESVSAKTVTIAAGEEKAKFAVKSRRKIAADSIPLTIEGFASMGEREVVRRAVPTEDWMQAFLWRHLVPTQELLAYMGSQGSGAALKRTPPPLPFADEMEMMSESKNGKSKSKSKSKDSKLTEAEKKVAGGIRQLTRLYQEGLLTDDFYLQKVAELKAYTEK